MTPILVAAGLVLTGCSEKQTTSTNNDKKVDVKEVKTISNEDFMKALNDKNYQFVDTRDDSSFNGFTNGEIKHGGHLKDAIQYSATFVGNVAEEKLKKYVSDKGLDINKKIVLYDTDKENLDKVSKEFSKLGYEVYKYEDYKVFANEDANKQYIESYPEYKMLVSASWLKDVMDNKKPETYSNDKYKVFEVSWGETDKAKEYNKEHIKGAAHFNTDWIEEGPIWNLQTAEKLRDKVLEQGITADTTVILYSDDASAAFRVDFALKWLGVKDVRILNGGLKSWKAISGETENKVNVYEKATDFGADVPLHPEYLISRAKDMYEKSQNEGIKLVSIRSWDEHIGKTSGYDYIPEKGEPKGAIYGFSGTNAQNMDDYYDPDGTLRNPEEIYKLWLSQGIKNDDKIAIYCGTGWRNSIPWFMTQLTDRKNTFFYDGGWNDWQMDKSLPVDVNSNLTEKPDSKNDFK